MFLCHVYSSHRESTIICINSIQMLVFVHNLAVLNIPSYDKHVILAEDLCEYAPQMIGSDFEQITSI